MAAFAACCIFWLLQLAGAGPWFQELFSVVFELVVRNLRYTRSIYSPAFVPKQEGKHHLDMLWPLKYLVSGAEYEKITTTKAFWAGDILAALPVPYLSLLGHSFWSRQDIFNPVVAALERQTISKPGSRCIPLC